MTREEKKTEMRIIAAHLITVMEDCCTYRHRLEECNSTREAKLMDTVIGKLYTLVNRISKEG